MSEGTSLLRIASQWLIALILTVVLTLFFLAIVGVQLTSEGPAERTLRRAVAVLTDIDALLPGIETDLHRAAREGEGDLVRVPDFPIPIDVPREEAAQIEGDALRDLILDQAGRRLYEDGMSVWAGNDPDARQSIERVSAAGAVQRGLGLLTDSRHILFIVAAIFLGVVSAILASLLMVSIRSNYVRLIALGSVTLAAALPSLAGAVALRFALKTAETEADPFVKGLLEAGVDTMRLPIRDYLALTALGFAVVALAAACLWWQARAASRRSVSYADRAP